LRITSFYKIIITGRQPDREKKRNIICHKNYETAHYFKRRKGENLSNKLFGIRRKEGIYPKMIEAVSIEYKR
jgi:hypothetical protein